MAKEKYDTLNLEEYFTEQGMPPAVATYVATQITGKKPLSVAKIVVDEDASGGVDYANASTGLKVGDEIVDAHMVIVEDSGEGGITVAHKGGNNITDTMDIGSTTANDVVRAGELDPDELVIGADGLTITAGSSADRAIVYITYIQA